MADLSNNANVDYPGAIPPSAFQKAIGSAFSAGNSFFSNTVSVNNDVASTSTNAPTYLQGTSATFQLPRDTMAAGNYQGGLSFAPMTLQKTTNGGWTSTGGFQFDLPMATIAAFQNNALAFTAANSDANRSFVDGVINRQSMGVANAAMLASGISSQALSAGYGIAQMNSDVSRTIANNSLEYGKFAQQQATERTRIQTEGAQTDSGCFFTTAVCEHWKMNDDCDILMTMRAFRDDVMLIDPELAPMVQEYYEKAPAIVEKINAMKNADQIWEFVGQMFIIPGVNLCKIGAHKMALYTYRKMCHYLDNITGE